MPADATSTPAPTRPKPAVVQVLRRLLPVRLYVAARTAVMSVFTPSVYAAQHGYFRSARTRTVVGSDGSAAPWMTFPLVTFLESKSFTGRSVLEFGAGHSTLWWAIRADRVVALETDAEWTALVSAGAPDNVQVATVPLQYDSDAAFVADVRAVIGGSRFDVVIVDGGDRVKALHSVPSVIADGGVLIVDDLDVHHHLQEWQAALAMLREEGFGRMDFYGLAVGVPFSRDHRCTSLFFRAGSFITDWA